MSTDTHRMLMTLALEGKKEKNEQIIMGSIKLQESGK